MIEYIRQLEDDNEKLREQLEQQQQQLNRLHAIIAHAMPDRSGMFYLTGGHGEVNDSLPEYVTICPGYGAGWEQVYQKTNRNISYEGS